MQPKFLPDIFKLINESCPVSLENEEEFIEKIAIKHDLPIETAKIIINLFFEEMRNFILDNKKVIIPKWGTMYISSPVTDGNIKRVFPKFKLSEQIKKEFNG